MHTRPSAAGRRLASSACATFAAVATFAAPLAAGPTAGGADPHAQHRAQPGLSVQRSLHAYRVPAVELTREDGARVALARELDDGRVVVLNFIYTTCTTICPMSSQVLSQFVATLGAERPRVHLVSISIDPEQDTPPRLREYAARFGAGPGWNHYTGSSAASIAVQRAFDVYRGDKMNHAAVTLLRAAPGQPWVRLEGFAGSGELSAELQRAQPRR